MNRQQRRQAKSPYELADGVLREVVSEARHHEDGRGIAAATLMTALNLHHNTVIGVTAGVTAIPSLKARAHDTLSRMSDALLEWLGKHSADQAEEIEQLKARIAELEQTPEVTMPERKLPPQKYFPDGPLESASLCVYLKSQGIPATWNSSGVDHGGQMTDAHAEAWRAAYPTKEAMMEQLRAVVRPILGRAA